MASYVDGFVIPVPKRKTAAYRRIARKAGKVWREHGALDYHECVADDVTVGKRTSFPRSVKLKDDEVVIFAYIVYASRRERDRINKAVMEDPQLKESMDPSKMPFDGKRMFWGGFKPFIDAQSCDIIHPDLAFCGGFTGAKKIADYAMLTRTPVALHKGRLILGAPSAQKLLKDWIRSAADVPVTPALIGEGAKRYAAACTSEEAREGLDALRRKRKPAWLRKAKQSLPEKKTAARGKRKP